MGEDNKTCRFGPESPYVDLAAEVFRLLSDPTRIRIILALREGERSVNELASVIGKTPTTVSQHLAKLRWGRVVSVRQDGTRMFYRLSDDRARELVAQAVFQAEHALDGASAHQRETGARPAHGPADGSCPAGEQPGAPA